MIQWGMGQWALGIGHGAMGIGHRASGNVHCASGMGDWEIDNFLLLTFVSVA